MRKYAVVQSAALSAQKDDCVKRVILYETKTEGVYVFLSSSEKDTGCDADYWFADLQSAEALCAEYNVHTDDWIFIDDPMPGCQHDYIQPVRVKGRELGKPLYGIFEILCDGKWIDYNPKNDM